MAIFYYFKFFGHFFFKKGNIQQSVKFLEEKIHHQKNKSYTKKYIWFFLQSQVQFGSVFFLYSIFRQKSKLKIEILKIDHFEFWHFGECYNLCNIYLSWSLRAGQSTKCIRHIKRFLNILKEKLKESSY
jgi:hypothetical protein